MSAAFSLQPEIKPEDVQILDSPWVEGRLIKAYYNPVAAEGRIPQEPRETYPDRVICAAAALTEELQKAAAEKGANAISFWECELDPFTSTETTWVCAKATPFKLTDPEPPQHKPWSPWSGKP